MYDPGGAAQAQSGLACLNKILCGMGGSKLKDCVGSVYTQNGGKIIQMPCDVCI